MSLNARLIALAEEFGKDIKSIKSRTGLVHYRVLIDSYQWRVVHNRGTTKFLYRLIDNDGYTFVAGVKIVNDNEFIVTMSEPTAGSIIVEFDDVATQEIYVDTNQG